MIICEAVQFRLTVLTVRMTQWYGWEVPGGLVQVNLFPLFVIGEGMQKWCESTTYPLPEMA